MSVRGIDVSSHQGTINWKKVRDSGIRFAIIRTGYGDTLVNPGQIDRNFHENMRNAAAAGVKVGVYHFSYAGTESAARQEARGVIALIKSYSLTYPVFFDYEYDSDRLAGKLDKKKLTDVALAFLKEIQQAGYQAGVYANLDFIRNRYDMARLKPYDLWLAHYNEIPGYPCELHQISDNGKVNGISGKVDTDVAYQDYGATSRITLDTQEYVFKKVNQTYRFLAKSEEPPVVTSSNPKAFPVKFIHKEKRGYLYELKALQQGMTTISAKQNGHTASFRASLGCQLDTVFYRCRPGDTYRFLSRSLEKPSIDPGNVQVVEVVSDGQDPRGYLFLMRAKKPGKATVTASLDGFDDSFAVEVEG